MVGYVTAIFPKLADSREASFFVRRTLQKAQLQNSRLGLVGSVGYPSGNRSNNSMQRTAQRAAADAERFERRVGRIIQSVLPNDQARRQPATDHRAATKEKLRPVAAVRCSTVFGDGRRTAVSPRRSWEDRGRAAHCT